MVDLELGDLVDRLRDVAGGITAVKQQAIQRVGEGTLLVLQQCLRRHPVVSLLLTTHAERQRECLSALREAQDADAAPGTNEILNTLAWINGVASELEMERLAAVFADTEKAHAWCRDQLQKRLGVVDTPLFTQNRESLVCPWNVLFTLLAGPLRDLPNATLTKAEMDIPNATTAMLGALNEIRAEWNNSVAWCNLLKELNAFPIGNVRAIWQCALYLFPTSSALVQHYIKREVEDLLERRPLRQCQEEDEARALFKAHLRILNTFSRHLQICYSCKLYELFFDYLFDLIEPDNPTHTDKLFRACLFRDVGVLPCSTPLWTRYMGWKSAYIRDERKRIEWRRSLFRRILQMPLLGTEKVKEEYDAFVSYELGGRVAPPEKIEMEKTYARAKMEAEEINQIFIILAPEERLTPSVSGAAAVPAYKIVHSGSTSPGGYGFFGVPPVLTPQLVAAYEPPPMYEEGVFITPPVPSDANASSSALAPSSTSGTELNEEAVRERLDHVRRMVAASTRLWGLWESLVRMIHISSLGTPALRRERVRVYLAMRACFFVHKHSSWKDLLDYVADGKGAAYSEKERLTLAEDVMQLHESLAVRGIFFPLYAADIFYHQLERRDTAFRLFQRAAQDELHWLLDFIRRNNQDTGDAATKMLRAQEAAQGNAASSTHLQNLCVLGINWMRLLARQQDRFHTLLVSRYMMHQIDFLSLTMSVLKLLLKRQVIDSPEVHLRPFNVFCAQWLRLEVVRNQNYEGAAQILWQWKEHLRMLLRSAKAKAWTAEMCGTDQSFVDACAALMTADPTRIPEILQCAEELAAIVRTDALGGNFLQQYEFLCHRFFYAPKPIGTLPNSVLSINSVAPASRIPSTHYDTQLFTPLYAEPLPTGWDGLGDEAARQSYGLSFTASPTAIGGSAAAAAFPEEGLWAVPHPSSSASSYHAAGGYRGRGGGRGGRGGRGMTFGRGGAAASHTASSHFDHFGKPTDGAAGGTRSTSKRTLVCSALAVTIDSFPLFAAGGSRGGRGGGGGADALVAQRSRAAPTNAIAALLTQLPTRYQYLPVDGDISTEWLLRLLTTTEALKWADGMMAPPTPSPEECTSHDDEEEQGEEGEEYYYADEEGYDEEYEEDFDEEFDDEELPVVTAEEPDDTELVDESRETVAADADAEEPNIGIEETPSSLP